MTRLRWTAPRIALAPLLAPLLAAALACGLAAAQPDAAPDAELPVTRVVLFTSGIGYFEHRGTVTGTQELELTVPTDQMDDLLQSLVLQDFGGGSVRPVRYPSRDPLARTLAGYALDLSGNPTLAELLVQARGEAVRIEAGETIEGRIVGVERTALADGASRTDLTLATAAGVQRVPLDEVRALRFEDAALRAEFDAALDALASGRSDDARSVRLRFEGEGERQVRIGYVREMPVWKSSYRLVLGADPDDPAIAELQGWAIVDNPTDLDLVDVEIAFVAGRPISFVTDLYDPVYAPRPRVQVETAPSLAPPADAGALPPAAPAPQLRAAPAAADALFDADVVEEAAEPEPGFAAAGVDALAEGARSGATFSYRVQEPVTVGRRESAMIPIVQQRVPAHDLALFDPALLPTTPLRGVRLVNDSGLHLAAGTVSVFGPEGFRGNARLGEVVPGESRLLTYAVDQEIEVRTERSSDPERITAVTLRGALLETTVRQRLRSSYRVAVRGEGAEARFLVLEHAKLPGFELTAPDPAPAETPDAYRFGVVLAGDGEAPEDPDVPVQLRCDADASCTLEVVQERIEARRVAVANVGGERIAFYLENVELSPSDRATLERVLELQRELARLDRDAGAGQARIDEIFREQQRIRQNMGALDRNSSLYRRYLTDLEQQENELDALQLALETLRGERRDAQERLDALLAGLEPGGDD